MPALYACGHIRMWCPMWRARVCLYFCSKVQASFVHKCCPKMINKTAAIFLVYLFLFSAVKPGSESSNFSKWLL
uniref:Uncharacterized protein n=1 Tax=Ornithodoros erraticus TaxID=265619 RepID=A0A293MTG3_ORNER